MKVQTCRELSHTNNFFAVIPMGLSIYFLAAGEINERGKGRVLEEFFSSQSHTSKEVN